MRLVVSKGTVVPFESLPPRSIALDGYVQGPRIDAEGRRYSFDHHAGCLRFATRSTIEQARDALKLGLDPEEFTVFANDVALDTAGSIFLLRHPEFADHRLIAELVHGAGHLDAFVGAYPLTGSWEYLDWIVEPLMAAREAGFYHTMGDREYQTMIEVIESRILQWIQGKASKEEIRDAHARLHGTPRLHYVSFYGWEMFESNRIYDTGMLLSRGHPRVVRYHASEGRFHYTVARASDFVDRFPVPLLLAALNAEEPERRAEWGGGTTVGGSPRPHGSALSPEQVGRIIDRVCEGLATA